MSSPHHGEERELMERFGEEMERRARRRWPDGRVSADDDGMTAFGFAHDRKHHVLRIEFSKPIDWMGLDVDAATQLRDRLNTFITEETE